jgi:hypothetical protein
VELCLTVPVRLSALLAHLHLLMRPLVFSLQVETGELPSQGLRTLELCVDNLTPEFLDPIMAPVRLELMQALWKHMRLGTECDAVPNKAMKLHSSNTTGYDHLAMRILGKLGGRSKTALREHQQLAYVHPSSTGLPLRALFNCSQRDNVTSFFEHMFTTAHSALKDPEGICLNCPLPVEFYVDQAVLVAYELVARISVDSETASIFYSQLNHVLPSRTGVKEARLVDQDMLRFCNLEHLLHYQKQAIYFAKACVLTFMKRMTGT